MRARPDLRGRLGLRQARRRRARRGTARGLSGRNRTVVGFPHGAHATVTKVFGAELALADGATELDMVINIGWLRSGEDARVQDDIAAVTAAASGQALVKVILENAYLTHDEKVRGCRLAEAAGADYVKTSTGFAPGGATLEDLAFMRATVSEALKVKAAVASARSTPC